MNKAYYMCILKCHNKPPQFVLLTYSNKNKLAKKQKQINKSKLDKNVITKKVKNKGEELQLKGMMEAYL